MKFDRNTVLGFLILGALFIGYFVYTSKSAQKTQKLRAEELKLEREQFVKDSLYKDSVDLVKNPKRDSLARAADSIAKLTRTNASIFKTTADTIEEKTISVDNDLIRVTFTNKGGQIKKVELKKFKGQDSNWVRLAGSDFDKISYRINSGQTANSGSVESGEQLFGNGIVDSTNKDSIRVSFTLPGDSTTSITHEFIVKKDDYMIDFNVKAIGANRLFDRGEMNLTWQYSAAQQESDISYEQQNTQVGYVKDGSFDYHTIGRRSSKDFNASTKWIGVRQRFFFGALVARDNFSSGKMTWTSPDDSAKTVVQSTATMKLSVSAAGEVPFSIYYGPSDYQTLKKEGLRFEKLINLGQGIYSFVRPLNKFLIMPIFDFMKGLTSNYGIAILLLTIVIRLLISPLTYKSYLSGAKMKALRPEIAALKDKLGNDRQAMSMEQMKLFREAGVNPLGGCIPALLQIPIFFALFSFFNSEVDLRGASFLWANDLAAFDDPIKFGFHIPLLGSHLSLFNITACATSFLISWYSMSMTPDQSNPILKYMPYIFPVFLLFFFNRLPSGLTWYYTVSNIITLVLQYIIQNYIIDHNKILAKIEENRKKPKTKSKWQERMEQMQEQQKKMREAQKKNRR